MKFYFLIMLLFSSTILAREKLDLNYSSYDDALVGPSNITFYMKSTKAGMITTSFEGVAKSFSIHYNSNHKRKKLTLRDIHLVIPSRSLDTDNNSRNKKMYEKCLQVDKYNDIQIDIKGPVKFEKENKAMITILGKKHEIMVHISKKEGEGKLMLIGQSFLSLKKLEIPDPSIWIATVDDNVIVKFHITLGN